MKIEVSPGEFYDRLSILHIKGNRIEDTEKLGKIYQEIRQMSLLCRHSGKATNQFVSLYDALSEINERLWDIEDGLRACEACQDFGAEFIELARASYKTNDQRSTIKRQINELLGSDLSEEKQYAEY